MNKQELIDQWKAAETQVYKDKHEAEKAQFALWTKRAEAAAGCFFRLDGGEIYRNYCKNTLWLCTHPANTEESVTGGGETHKLFDTCKGRDCPLIKNSIKACINLV